MENNVSNDFRQKEKGSFIQNKLVPFMGKLGQQRHLGAIRDAFATLIPLIIAGSIGTLINAIVFGGAGSGFVSILGLICKIAHPGLSNADISSLLAGNDITKILPDGTTQILIHEVAWGKISTIFGLAFGHIATATIGMISIYFSFLFAYYISLSRNFSSPIICGMTSTAALVLSALGNVAFVQGAPGLIAAIIITLISSEIFIKLSSVKALIIKLPDGVPPAVGKSFSVFLPAAITLAIISGLDILVFAPAIIWKDLYVSTGENFSKSFANDAEWVDFLSKLNMPTKDLPSWWDKDLLEHLKGTDTIQKFSDWVSTLNDHQKSVLSSMMSMGLGKTNNTGLANQILSGDSKSVIHAIMSNGKLILSMNYQKINIDYTGFGLAQAIFQFFSSWFIGFATGNGSLGIALAYVLFVSIFWIFGIHGTNLLMGIFAPIWLMIVIMNNELVTAAGSGGYEAAKTTGQMGIFASPFFDTFVFIGGAGCTLTLLTSTFIFSRRQELKEIAKYATPAGCFQINEPVMFGFPLVLNPIYAAPFVATQIVNLFVAWIFVKTGAVKMATIQTPWTAPWFLGAVISTIDYKALIPAFINFGIDLLIYIPFTIIDNKLYFSKLKKNNPDAYELEMKFYTDREYRFEVITERKISALEEKAATSLSNAVEYGEQAAKRISNSEKLAKIQQQYTDKGNIKKDLYLKKVEELKAQRALKLEKLKEVWANKDAKKNKAN